LIELIEYKLKDLISQKITGEWGSEPKSKNEGVFVLRTTNFTNIGKLNFKKVVKRVIDKTKIDKKKLKIGDIIIEKSGGSFKQPVGRVVFFEKEDGVYLCNNFTTILRPNELIYPKYLLYQLHYNHKIGKTLKFQNQTTGIINLKLDKYLNSKVKIPKDINKQKKIANLLTEVEALIVKREESIKLLDELLKSSFLDMFGDPVLNTKGWEVKSFKYFAKIDTNMTKDFEKYQNYPHIGVANIEKNTGKLINYKLIKDENLTSGKYLFTPKHIIYSKIRPNLNKVALPNFNGLASADSYPILVYPDITNRYFFAYVLRSDAFLRFILNFSVRANIPKINKKQLEKFFCYNPPKPLQDEFATIVQQIESTKEQYQNSLDELNELFDSLSQKAFKGELDLSKMELSKNQDESLQKMLDSQKAYDKALETKIYESSLTHVETVSIKSIPKENLEIYIFDLIQSNTFIIEDIQHLFEIDFTYNDVKEKIFEMLEEGKIKHTLEEYTTITEQLGEKTEHTNKQVKLVVSS